MRSGRTDGAFRPQIAGGKSFLRYGIPISFLSVGRMAGSTEIPGNRAGAVPVSNGTEGPTALGIQRVWVNEAQTFPFFETGRVSAFSGCWNSHGLFRQAETAPLRVGGLEVLFIPDMLGRDRNGRTAGEKRDGGRIPPRKSRPVKQQKMTQEGFFEP